MRRRPLFHPDPKEGDLPPVTVKLEQRIAELEKKLADSAALEPGERAKLAARIETLEKELAAKKGAPAPADEPPPKKKPGALPWW